MALFFIKNNSYQRFTSKRYRLILL